MRGQLTFKIDGRDKEFMVQELICSQIIEIFDKKILDNLTFEKIRSHFVKKVLPEASNIKESELLSLAPSEVEVIWKKFQEVNSVFFRTLKQISKTEVVGQIKAALLTDFFALYAKSLKQAT